MRIFLDTANIDQIRQGAKLGVISGVTTNPSLMMREGLADYEAAVKAYTYAIDSNPKHPLAYLNRGVVNIKLGNRRQALKDLKFAAKLGHRKARDCLRSRRIALN